MKKNEKVIAMILVLGICFNSAGINVLAQEQPPDMPVELSKELVGEIQKENWDGVTTESVYESTDYRVIFFLTEHWEGGYSAKVKIENTGASIIENWALEFEYKGEITELSSAVIDSQEENKYIIKNAGWNQDITVGGSVEFCFGEQKDFSGFPKEYELLGNKVNVAEEDYTIAYTLEDDWGSGFSASMVVTNNTNVALEDWVLEFDFDREITSIWDAVIESHEGNHYVIRNAGYNANIASGQNISFGFDGTAGSIDTVPQNSKLYSYEANAEIDLNLDTDQDGAEDYIEKYFGTDAQKTDTDGDGLSDFLELYSLVLDPLSIDTNGDGICDSNEDLDEDGLNNISETYINTSIVESDTDNDGLSDSDENIVYGTNATQKDTDADGVSDAKEIAFGTNPFVYEDTFNICANAKNEDTVKVSVEVELSGEQAESLSVTKYENELFFPTNMPGYIGGAYDFYVDGTFDSARINFEFDETLLDDADFDPVIYYFNEETQLLEELDTTISGNIATTEVAHFSKYILLNRKVYQNTFEWQDVWTTNEYTGVEVVLVIDDSESMRTRDKFYQRLSVAQKMIDNLPDNSKVGVVKFSHTTSKLTPRLTDDKETVKSYLTTNYFKASGGTQMYNAINEGLTLYESTDENILKMMVMLTDGETSDQHLQTSVTELANDKAVKVYTVGLGTSSFPYFEKYLKPLANNTAGTFYFASDASQLETIYDDINKKIDIEADSDNDGIADYYEDNMVIFNGITIKLDKYNPDSDRDGLVDGEEIENLNYQYNADKSQVIVTGKMVSDPFLGDSDGDGLTDEEEIYYYGTSPVLSDTDGDGLSDLTEVLNWYDPFEKDADGDGRFDLQEYQDGTSPYRYDKSWYEHTWDFICGFVAGDFISDTDSLPTIMGQITSSFIPLVDIRDVIGNLAHGDYAFAGLSALGLVPIAGDVTKAAGKVGKFVLKNVDNISEVAGILEFLNKNFPDVVEVLAKNDDFVDAVKQISNGEWQKITKKEAESIAEAYEKAGLSEYAIKGGLNSVDDIFTQGKKAFDDFDIESAYVKPKHLSTTGGSGQKFIGANKSEAESILKDALSNGKIISITDNGLTKAGKQSYGIVIDAGKTVGTKGETLVKIVISSDGGMLSAYPIK